MHGRSAREVTVGGEVQQHDRLAGCHRSQGKHACLLQTRLLNARVQGDDATAERLRRTDARSRPGERYDGDEAEVVLQVRETERKDRIALRRGPSSLGAGQLDVPRPLWASPHD